MALVIMGTEAKQVPIKPKEIQFDKDGRKTIYVDKAGKVVKKIQVQASEYKWTYEDGTEFDGKAYKAIKGKPIKEFSKTTLIDKYDTCDISDMAYMVNNEHTYMLVGDKLKAKLKELEKDGKMICFKFVIRGFKVYRACVYYSAEHERVFMRCFRGDIRQADLNEESTEVNTKSDDGVKEMSLDDLEV